MDFTKELEDRGLNVNSIVKMSGIRKEVLYRMKNGTVQTRPLTQIKVQMCLNTYDYMMKNINKLLTK